LLAIPAAADRIRGGFSLICIVSKSSPVAIDDNEMKKLQRWGMCDFENRKMFRPHKLELQKTVYRFANQ
jgi:D-alanyl-D-alanine carboxypeptidase